MLRWFRRRPPDEGEVGYVDGDLVARVDGTHRLGAIDPERAGYREDAAAAAAVAIAYGVDPAAAAAALAGFRPGPHRGEVVATVDGVRFVDNSKATNVHAAAAAIDGAGDAVLIAGGRAKGVDLSPLKDHSRRLRAVIAIGESAPDVVDVFEGSFPSEVAGSIEEAVRDAFAAAVPGDTVLLAPACASWDQFTSYVERGIGSRRRPGRCARRRAPVADRTITRRRPKAAGSRASHLRLVRTEDLMRAAPTAVAARVGTSRSSSCRPPSSR